MPGCAVWAPHCPIEGTWGWSHWSKKWLSQVVFRSIHLTLLSLSLLMLATSVFDVFELNPVGCWWSHMADTALWFFDSPTPTSEGGSLKSIQDARGINRFSYLSKCKYLHKDSLAEYEMAYLGRDALCRVFVQHSAVSPRTKTVLLKHFKACPPTFGWMARWVTFCPQVRSAELCWAVLSCAEVWSWLDSTFQVSLCMSEILEMDRSHCWAFCLLLFFCQEMRIDMSSLPFVPCLWTHARLIIPSQSFPLWTFGFYSARIWKRSNARKANKGQERRHDRDLNDIFERNS